MADMFVHILVENLKELMRSKHPIIGSKRNQATLGFLHNNVYLFSNFLKRTELEKCSADEEVKLLLTEIRDVTYQVENYVDSFVQEAIVAARVHADAINRSRQWFSSSTIWNNHFSEQLSFLTLQVENVDCFVQEAIVAAREHADAINRIRQQLSSSTFWDNHFTENYVDSFVQEAIVAGRKHADAINRTWQRWSWTTICKNQPTLQGENYVENMRMPLIAPGSGRPPRPGRRSGKTSSLFDRSHPNWSRSDRSCWKMLRKPIEAVKIGVDHMNAKLDLSKLTLKTIYRSADDGQKRVRIEDSETVVGIEDTMDKLLSQLTDGSKSMEVISIVGLPGIGKSTVAQRVFDHGRIKSTFPIRAWSTVSQTYDCKRLLIDILQSSSLFEDGDDASTADQLGEALLKRLKGKRYLVVLDDVWSIEAWNVIQRSFPDQHNRSRALFTSRFAAIGKDVSDDINTHYMSGLSEEHSWNLLKNRVFGNRGQCPPELEGSGMEMVRKCDGLPLAIVVTGGLLAKKDKKPEFWEQVASNLAPAIATDQEASFMNTIELSYQHLPVHLKACFLYVGSFPLEYKLSLRSLIWLLIAEGFVIQGTEEKSLEITAEGYLNELVEWSFVTVAKKRSCGAMKSVRIHDLLRVFCVARGNQEKFNTTPYEYFDELFRKIAGCKHLPRDPMDRSLRSLRRERPICRDCRLQTWESILKERRFDCYHYRPSNVRSFCSDRNFRLLKVLGRRNDFFQGLGNLVHLRYFSFGDIYEWSNEFALSITKFLNLETLFLESSILNRVALDLSDDVWNMVKLRHLYYKRGVFHFKAYPPQGAVLGNLQTLHTLCACDSCLTMLVRTPNIRKLGLSGDFRDLNLCFLKLLESLKVVGTIWSWKAGILPSLELPASLRKLTLQNTFLRWENISFLERLRNLEVVKLLNNAFSVEGGNEFIDDIELGDIEFLNLISSSKKTDAYWDTSEVDFPKLKYLKMQGLDIVKWEDQNLQFESLEVLVLDNCPRLETIPFDLAGCPSLQTIDVGGCTTSVSKLAKEIEVEHENMYGNSNL